MNDTIYWAVKLDERSRNLLLSKFPPKHPNVFAEHMTIVFKPTDKENMALMDFIGKESLMIAYGYAEDDKGQTIGVDGFDIRNEGNATTHITISCANGIKPVYSKTLIKNGYISVEPFNLTGIVSRFTKDGWKIK